MRFEMRQPPPNYVVLSLRSRGDIYDLQAQRIMESGTLAQFCVYTRRASHAPRAGRTYFAATTISRGAGAPPAPRAGGGTKLERRLPCNLKYFIKYGSQDTHKAQRCVWTRCPRSTRNKKVETSPSSLESTA